MSELTGRGSRASRVRWWIVALLFYATALCYLDRIVFSFLAPEIRGELHFTAQAYGYLTGAFQIAYAVGFLFSGRWIDRVGTRIGFATTMAWWCIAIAFHGIVRTALPSLRSGQGLSGLAWVFTVVSAPFLSLVFWRAMLGLGESGNFPAAVKSVAEWFPATDRALATGIFNAGSNLGAMAGPPLIAALYVAHGWRACFLATGGLGLVWLVLWLTTYHPPEKHPRVNRAELAYIRSVTEERRSEASIGWKKALTRRETWGFAAGKFLTNPVWMLYLWWLPLLLNDVFKVTPANRGWAVGVVYVMSGFGSVLGGWISGSLIRRGWALRRARIAAMAMCAFCMPVGTAGVLAPNAVTAVALLSLAAAAHQGWAANLFTTVSDIFPKGAVASVVSIGMCAGAVGSFLFSSLIPGYAIGHFGYRPVFLSMGCFHVIALLLVNGLMGNMGKISFDTTAGIESERRLG